MKDVLGRQINLGDLIISYRCARGATISKDMFAVAIAENKAFGSCGFFKLNKAYLIEHPSEQDLAVKRNLVTQYRQRMQRDIEKSDAIKSIKKDIRKTINIGDVFSEKYHPSSYAIYLGKRRVRSTSGRVDYNSPVHVYLKINELLSFKVKGADMVSWLKSIEGKNMNFSDFTIAANAMVGNVEHSSKRVEKIYSSDFLREALKLKPDIKEPAYIYYEYVKYLCKYLSDVTHIYQDKIAHINLSKEPIEIILIRESEEKVVDVLILE